MSNYDFLLKNKEILTKQPWFGEMYHECTNVEKLYFIDKNTMLAKSRSILESIANYYLKETGTAPKQLKLKDEKKIDRSKKVSL